MPSVPDVPVQPATKVCTKCGERKPETDYYVKDKTTGRRYSWCRLCHGTPQIPKQLPLPLVGIPLIRCTSCHALKDIGAFRPARIETTARRCRECDKEAGAAYYAVHPEKIRERDEKYRRNHLEELRARARERYNTDERYGPTKQQQWRQEHGVSSRQSSKKYRAANPDVVRINTMRRRVRLLQAEGDFTTDQWRAMKARYGFRCLCCGRAEPEITLSMDHVVPLIAGGEHTENNIQPLCGPCNSRKHRRDTDYRAGKE